ncbi:MAG: cupin domain-containing protein [Casimicrobiaceae bacterium]
MPHAINFLDKLARFDEHWSPRVIAEMNDYQFKLVKFQGEFVWHAHDDTDEVFIVLQGEMQIAFRDWPPRTAPRAAPPSGLAPWDGPAALVDEAVTVRAGEMFVVPKGREHITRATTECHALLIEPRGVVNTGDAGGPLTAQADRWV